MMRIFGFVLSVITLFSLLFDGGDPFLKSITVALCVATTITYLTIYKLKRTGFENPKIALFSGVIWCFNTLLQSFLLWSILSKTS